VAQLREKPSPARWRGLFNATEADFYMLDLVVVFVVLVDLVMPEGVVMVLVLLMPAADLVEVLDLRIPAGLVIVVVLVVVAGVCEVVVVDIFDELLLMVVPGVVWAWAERPPATTSRARICERRFMGERENGW
jgi:hypothetical protein